MSRTFIPIERFGKDHWSVFAYLETRAVDHKGSIDLDRMRTDPERHPGLVGPRVPRSIASAPYPTMLRRLGKGLEKLPNHDDWDCFDDLEQAGLVVWKGSGINPIVKLTKQGRIVASALREFKAGGGNFCDFVPPGVKLAAV